MFCNVVMYYPFSWEHYEVVSLSYKLRVEVRPEVYRENQNY